MKKTTGEILAVNELFEKRPQVVKNYAAFVRYDSRSGTHNIYKEFRDTTRVGAVNQLCNYFLSIFKRILLINCMKTWIWLVDTEQEQEAFKSLMLKK